MLVVTRTREVRSPARRDPCLQPVNLSGYVQRFKTAWWYRMQRRVGVRPAPHMHAVVDMPGGWEIACASGSAPLDALARFVEAVAPMLARRGFMFEKAWEPGTGWVHWATGDDQRAAGWGHIRAFVIEDVDASTAELRIVARGRVSHRLQRAVLDVASGVGATSELASRTTASQAFLHDYADLLWRGWVNSKDPAGAAASEAQLETWVDSLVGRANADGLSVSSSIGFDVSVDGLRGASVHLNWPTGEPSSAHNSGGLPARLEREWGATLVDARAQLEADSGERSSLCPSCNGSGFDHIGDWDANGRDELFHDHTCEQCSGRGRIFEASATS